MKEVNVVVSEHKRGQFHNMKHAKTPELIVIKSEYASFPSDGRGRVRLPHGMTLKKGQHVAVTDDEADTLEAEVLADSRNGRAEVRLNWSKVIRKAD